MFVDDAFFGMARTGILEDEIRYPAILRTRHGQDVRKGNHHLEVGRSVRIPYDLGASNEAIEGASAAISGDEIIVIPNGAQLVQRPKKLIETIMQIHKSERFGKLIYLQGLSEPFLLPVLVYAGVSLFDDSTLRMQSLKRVRYTDLGYTTSQENPYDENMRFVNGLLDSLAISIRTATLREVAEKYQLSSKSNEMLRIMDREYAVQVEETYPTRTPYIMANSLESLRRPDLVRYRDYISNEYRKPESRRIALLIPCSARKPYSRSKSHMKIIEALSGMRNIIHEIIVTSPVGIVPRDLEEAYPAAFYDIPVIGEWYEDEKAMIKEMLSRYFGRNTYSRIYSFVDSDLDFIFEALPRDAIRVHWDKSDRTSVSRLRQMLLEDIQNHPEERRERGPGRLENYLQIASYQFGPWITEHMMDCRIVRNYNSEMLVKDGKPFLVYNPAAGKFTINRRSAEHFVSEGKFLVEIDDFRPTANIYAVGVKSVTPDIRQEDEVVICHDGEVRGVGIAKMPGSAMQSIKKGIAVKVRN